LLLTALIYSFWLINHEVSSGLLWIDHIRHVCQTVGSRDDDYKEALTMAFRQVYAPVASVTLAAALAALLVGGAPSAFARDDENETAQNKSELRPKPDSAKVYTNDDLGWKGATPAPTGEVQPGQTAGGFVVPSSSPKALRTPSAPPAALNPQQDVQWYAGPLKQMQAELAGIENQEAQLRDFRASGSTQGQTTGLTLNAPAEGITTDNLIAQLDARRQELNARIDELNDMAGASGVAPAAVAQAAEAGPQLSPDEQREELIARHAQLSDELAKTQSVAADMRQQAAANGTSLLPPTPGFGGNMTTDLQSRLAARADKLQNEINNTAGDALGLGTPPGDLR
jgi:hypothetical protein